ALRADADLGMRLLPHAVARERREPRQVEVARDRLDQDVRHRRRRFADRKARMRPALEQDHVETEPARDECGERTAETGTDDREVEGGLGHPRECSYRVDSM